METEKKEMPEVEVKTSEQKEVCAHDEKKCCCEKYKEHLPKIIAAIVLVILVAGFGYYKMVWSKTHLTTTAAKAKVEDFINNNLMQPGTKAEISDVTKENGMFKVMLKIGEGDKQQEYTSYLSLDGKKFIPDGKGGVMDIAQVIEEKAKNSEGDVAANSEPQAEIPKTDKPVVELFIMSYCPYGTQIQKGIIPVVETLGAKMNYSMKFVSYAMHEKVELDENLKQYCIGKNEPAKLSAYLKCFLKDSKQAEACVKSAGVNAVKLTSCVSATDKQFKVSEKYADKSTWSGGQFPTFDVNKEDNVKYGVQGSPTLIVNGVEVKGAGRDSASLLKTICSAFKTEPKECSTSLSATAPAPGFGEGTAVNGASADAACGN
ncbi:MAG: DsbA family protein [Candidatus Moraniibacteriota bacterium]